MRRRLAALIVLGVAGCSLLRPEAPPPPVIDGVQVGIASWYGPGFDGRLTASGEPYDQRALTAAHRTLPIGTRATVTSLENGRTVDVRINDRGPFVGGRVIDLSRAAAQALHMIGPGLMRVRVEVVGGPRMARGSGGFAGGGGRVYVVQVGTFTRRRSADALRDDLVARFPETHVARHRSGSSEHFRVRVGPFDSRDAAVERASRVARLGYAPIILRTTWP